jgi:4-oxalocrotonate tautomerase
MTSRWSRAQDELDRDRPGATTKEAAMPFIDVKVMEGVLSAKQKEAIASGFTDVFASTVGEPARGVTWVVIQDIASGQWTMGGNPVTTDGVKDLLRNTPTHA